MLSTKRGGTGRHGQVSRSCAALIAIVATLVCQACESVNPVNSFDAQLISTNAPPLASVGRLAVIGGSVSSQVVAILDLDEQRQVGFLGFNAVVAAIALHPLDRSLWLSFARSPVGPFGIYRVDPGSNQIARVGVPDSLTHATQLWFSSDGERLYVAQSQDELFLVHVGQPTRVERLPTSIDLENTWKIDRIAYSSRGGLAASGFQNGPRAPVIESMLLFVSEQKRFRVSCGHWSCGGRAGFQSQRQPDHRHRFFRTYLAALPSCFGDLRHLTIARRNGHVCRQRHSRGQAVPAEYALRERAGRIRRVDDLIGGRRCVGEHAGDRHAQRPSTGAVPTWRIEICWC